MAISLVAIPLPLLEDGAPLPAVIPVVVIVVIPVIIAPVVPAIILVIGPTVVVVVRHGRKGSRHYYHRHQS